MKTRSKPQISSTAAAESKSKSITTASLPPSVQNPPKPFILPRDLSKDARIITLSDPATSSPNRYLFCPEKGFYEFTRIAAPKKQPRSWLFAPRRAIDSKDGLQANGNEKSKETEEEHTEETSKEGSVEDSSDPFAKGYITQNADLLIATPMDGLFLVLPALAPESKAKASQKQMFLSLDDHLDKLGESSKHLRHILQISKAKALLETRLSTVCDAVDAGDEQMYRLSPPKLLAELLSKARNMTANGLPASMEDKFIRSALQAPIMSIQRTDTQETIEDTPTPSESTATESQLSTETAATSFSIHATADAPKPPIEAPADIVALLRLRTALNFILTRYIPPTLLSTLITLLASGTTPSFAPLDAHLAHLATLRAEAVALRSISDNVSRKRAVEEDDEAAEMRAEKKRRKEEEEKRKKGESRGVKQLKKVDTSGMKKMSAFFGRAVKK